MPTKTAAKNKVNGAAVEEAEQGITPTPVASADVQPAEEGPAKSSEPDTVSDQSPEADGGDSDKEPSPPDPEKDPEGFQRFLYPKDADLWVGSVRNITFVFPRLSSITPTRQFLRRLYNLDPLFQNFEWLQFAEVPEPICNLTDVLTDEEFNALFEAWFTDAEVDGPK